MISTISLLLSSLCSFNKVLCLLGVLICKYAVGIENSKEKKKRMCDVNESMSCTRVLTSKYGHMAKLLFGLKEDNFFNLSNAQYGLIYYIGLLLFQFYPLTLIPYHDFLCFIGTLGSFFASLGLAWILYFKLHDFCMVCVAMYIVNSLLLTSAIRHLFYD
jgi:vitamin-K-epoxide reductase (warfarin-sensitive)